MKRAVTQLEKTNGTQPTPTAVKDWLALHAHIDLPPSEVSKYMQTVYKNRGEHSLFTILLSKTITSDGEAKQYDKDDNNNNNQKW